MARATSASSFESGFSSAATCFGERHDSQNCTSVRAGCSFAKCPEGLSWCAMELRNRPSKWLCSCQQDGFETGLADDSVMGTAVVNLKSDLAGPPLLRGTVMRHAHFFKARTEPPCQGIAHYRAARNSRTSTIPPLSDSAKPMRRETRSGRQHGADFRTPCFHVWNCVWRMKPLRFTARP